MKKKSKFKRQDFQLKKLKNKWRRPKGLHSKLRLKKSGHQKKPSIGYKKPEKLRNLVLSKFKFVKVNSLKDLEYAKEGIVISKNVGNKKRIKIIEKALELKLKILNIKNPEEFVKKITDELKVKRERKKKKEESKKEQVKKVKKKEETKEDKEKKEKEVKRKILEGKK